MRADSTRLSWFVGMRWGGASHTKATCHVMCLSRSNPGLCREPSVNAALNSASRAIIGNLLTIGEAKTVAQDQGVSRAHVLLSNRALADTVTRL